MMSLSVSCFLIVITGVLSRGIHLNHVLQQPRRTEQRAVATCPYTMLKLHANVLSFNGVSYELVPTSVHGIAAKRECQSKGGNLVGIPDQATQVCLYQGLKSLSSSTRINSVWIGLSDTQKEGNWKWDDGAPFTYHNWASGEPGSTLGLYNEDCVVMSMKDGHWKDYRCDAGFLFGTSSFSYVCEHKIPATTSTTATITTTSTTTTTTTTIPTTATTTTATTTVTSTSAITPPATTVKPCPIMLTCPLDCGLAGFKKDAAGCLACACANS